MDYVKLSKVVSYVLRHAPWEYQLELDKDGWVNVDQLLDSLQTKKEWQKVCESDLKAMIDLSDKKRHEIFKGKIKALYGHSIPTTILKEPQKPPERLYHGTTRYSISSIKKNGLLPNRRQYVHLSVDIDTAYQVGKRRDDEPVILIINSRQAWDEGVTFYQGNSKVWLVDDIPSKYIE